MSSGQTSIKCDDTKALFATLAFLLIPSSQMFSVSKDFNGPRTSLVQQNMNYGANKYQLPYGNTYQLQSQKQNYNLMGDLIGSASSGYGGNPGSCFTIDICPDLILAAIVAAAGLGAVLIFNAIVAAGKRRRRRRGIFSRHF